MASRKLSIMKLTKGYGACVGATLQFGRLFNAVLDVEVTEDYVRSVSPDWFTNENVGRMIDGAGWILSKDGYAAWLRAVRRKGVEFPKSDAARQEHLALMARYYVSHPKRARRA